MTRDDAMDDETVDETVDETFDEMSDSPGLEDEFDSADDESADDDLDDADPDDDESDDDDEFDADDDDADYSDPVSASSDVPSTTPSPAGRSGAPTVGLQTLPVTGEPRVDDALARLTDLSSLPVDEHVGVFEDVQRRLHDTLADLSGQ